MSFVRNVVYVLFLVFFSVSRSTSVLARHGRAPLVVGFSRSKDIKNRVWLDYLFHLVGHTI